ncbi:hypothetical protein A0H81_02504 [Grifola frondosa]|uniref:Swiss Army Knife protein DSP-PTPase phosphatase domain-containing protein n=1 Tax=Grifola frondosa TaxID=5627 RepID=A0A1C7MT30_GRIFR|nr:hypothetical protein A0H81_02504 [Grifola frondosa]
MSTPREALDIDALASPHFRIRHVLTLTKETPPEPEWFARKGIRNTFLPVPNFHPPTIEQMDLAMRFLDDADNLPMLIHCGGGKGRAGRQSAQSRWNSRRFVSKYYSTIWKRQSIVRVLAPEPPPCPLIIEGTLATDSDLFILVGLPGSGKSYFSRTLLARNPRSWTHISQDDMGTAVHARQPLAMDASMAASCWTGVMHRLTTAKNGFDCPCIGRAHPSACGSITSAKYVLRAHRTALHTQCFLRATEYKTQLNRCRRRLYGQALRRASRRSRSSALSLQQSSLSPAYLLPFNRVFWITTALVNSRAFLIDAYHGLSMVHIADAFVCSTRDS